MSRNLCNGNICDRCSGNVHRTGEWKNGADFEEIRRTPYKEYLHQRFCYARCCRCGTPYLGWGEYQAGGDFTGEIIDLSFRSTFDDESYEDDQPMATIPTLNEEIEAAIAFESEAQEKGQ